MSINNPHHNFMRKKGGPIVRVPKNKWAHYRRSGYEFATEEEYNEQLRGNAPEETVEAPTDANTKAEIVAFCNANQIEVDGNDTKADLLAKIEVLLA